MRSSYTWWKGSYTASAGALSLSMMATSYDAAKSGNKVPTVIVTHESEWSSFEALLQPQVRFQFATAGYPKIDGGFQYMMFRNTPLIADEYATDGYENTYAHTKSFLIGGTLRLINAMGILWKQLVLNYCPLKI